MAGRDLSRYRIMASYVLNIYNAMKNRQALLGIARHIPTICGDILLV